MTDQELGTALQYGLMEPPDGGATYPSGLWTPAEVWASANERQNRFLKNSRYQVGSATLTAVIGVHRYALPDDWLTTVSLTWIGADGTVSPMDRSDSFEADHGLPTWSTTRGTPDVFMDEDSPLLTIQVAPAPIAAGTFALLYIPQGAELDGTGQLITLADEYATPVLKYGVYADLLNKDGRGKNPGKAAYAELRYQLGLDMSQILLRGWV